MRYDAQRVVDSSSAGYAISMLHILDETSHINDIVIIPLSAILYL